MELRLGVFRFFQKPKAPFKKKIEKKRKATNLNFISKYSDSPPFPVSSNFERLLFEAGGRDASSVRRAMDSLRRSREFAVDARVLAEMRATFLAGTASQVVLLKRRIKL